MDAYMQFLRFSLAMEYFYIDTLRLPRKDFRLRFVNRYELGKLAVQEKLGR